MQRGTVILRGSPIKSIQAEQDKDKEIILASEKVAEKMVGRAIEAIYPLKVKNGRGVEEAICQIEAKDVSENKGCQDGQFENIRDGDDKLCRQTDLQPSIMGGKDGQQIIRATDEKNFDLCNYCVQPIKREIYLNRFGNEIKEREEIICQIKIESSYPMEFSILTRDIRRLTLIIGDKFSGALLNPDIKHAAKNVENLFRKATQGIPVSKNYIDHGWQKIDDVWVYVHDGLSSSGNLAFRTGMRLPFYNCDRRRAAQIFFQAYNLYEDKGPMSVMLAFSMLGVLYRVFDEARYAPQFLLFVNGKTGSMKTTLSKILFIQLTDDMHRDTPRRIQIRLHPLSAALSWVGAIR